MRWSNIIDLIKSKGFAGDGEDFDAVTDFLEAEGHSPVVVYGEGETPYQLKELYQNRKGKILDASDAERQSRLQDEIEAGIEKRLSRLHSTVNPEGVGTKFRNGEQEQKHLHVNEVKVGKDLLADDPKGGYNHAGEFFKDVYRKGVSGFKSKSLDAWEKAATTYSNEGTGVDGGFAVPTEFRATIESHYAGEDSILARTDQIQLSSNSITIPDDETTPYDTSGIVGYWDGEAQTAAQSKVSLNAKTLRAKKYTILCPVTEELLEDSAALASYMPRKAGEKLDFAVGESIFRGAGAGQPVGFLNHAALVSVAKESSQVADTVTALNLIKMYARMWAPWQQTAVWMMHPSVQVQLMQATIAGRDNAGNAVSTWGSAPVYLPAGSIAGSPYATILGRPAIVTEHCNEVGDLGDIVFVNFRKYQTAIRGGVKSSQSMHVWFDQDVVAFKFQIRMDGQPAISGPVSPRDGSDTYSAFVGLAARG